LFSKKTKAGKYAKRWCRFWMRFSWSPLISPIATRLVELLAPPHFDRVSLSYMHPKGYIASDAEIYHNNLLLGEHIYIGKNTLVFQRTEDSSIELKKHAVIHENVFVESGQGGKLILGEYSSIHPNSLIMAYCGSIIIGERVMIASNCALYPYDHGAELATPIADQALTSKGPIIIGDGAWLGTRVIVLSGVTIGSGAIIGAGSIVTKDIPDNAIAVGSPAKVVKMRL